MGYAQRTKGYRIWLIDENKLVETINFQRQVRKRPQHPENPDVSSDNHSLIPYGEVKWIRNIDSDFATNRDDRVSMGGVHNFYGETPISWRTFKQDPLVCRPWKLSMLVLTEAAKEFIWLRM
ncbi:retrovirus-related Pol polyprotein from transposon TNT 1-94 [Trichonephila clavipes]|nr:retrovirus-related Pol polyprotein from transposon TNT 1-94 [Trichonephila clavipes]